MLGVGWTEMLVIGVVALIVIGPKDLPMLMQRLGKVIGTVRRLGTDFQREINKTTGLEQITDLRRTLTEPLKKTAEEITREFNRTTPSGETVPSGIIKPADPKIESVVDEIHAATGMSSPETAAAVMRPLAAASKAVTAPVESPAPVEAIAPPRKRKPKAVVDEGAAVAPAAKPRARKPKAPADTVAAVEAVADTPSVATPRRKRTPQPKAEP